MPDSDMGADAPWMDWMRRNRGQVQQTGAVPTPFTARIFKHTSFGDLKGSTPESCAATVCAALEESGYKSTHSAAAASYELYGTKCDLKPNCVVVYQWPNGGHHVDFCDRIVDANTVMGLGGNQGHSLQDSLFARKFIVATRWPVKADGPAPGQFAGAAPVDLAVANVADFASLVEVEAAVPEGGLAGATATVRQGHRYAATVTLFGFEQLAGNSTVADKLAALGFVDVNVAGSGATRQAQGTWTGADATVALDSHLSNVREIT